MEAETGHFASEKLKLLRPLQREHIVSIVIQSDIRGLLKLFLGSVALTDDYAVTFPKCLNELWLELRQDTCYKSPVLE